MVQQYSGPLPHPDMLIKYEDALPGSADRIIKMAELQSLHRQSVEKSESEAKIHLEKQYQKSEFIITVFGQIFAFAICVLALSLGVYCILNGILWAGGFLGGFPIVAIIGMFLFKRKKSS